MKLNLIGLVKPKGFKIIGEETIQSCEINLEKKEIEYLPYDSSFPIVEYNKIRPLLEWLFFRCIPSSLPDKIPSEIWKGLVCPALEMLGAIPKKNLVVGKEYQGRCRNSDKAVWKGEYFEYDRTKFGSTYKEKINHYEDDNGYDLFIPYVVKSKSTEN